MLPKWFYVYLQLHSSEKGGIVADKTWLKNTDSRLHITKRWIYAKQMISTLSGLEMSKQDECRKNYHETEILKKCNYCRTEESRNIYYIEM